MSPTRQRSARSVGSGTGRVRSKPRGAKGPNRGPENTVTTGPMARIATTQARSVRTSWCELRIHASRKGCGRYATLNRRPITAAKNRYKSDGCPAYKRNTTVVTRIPARILRRKSGPAKPLAAMMVPTDAVSGFSTTKSRTPLAHISLVTTPTACTAIPAPVAT